MSRNVLIENKSVILIKKEEASLDEYISMLNTYRLKYPSHFGYVSWSPITRKYKKMDSVWWSFQQFMDDLKKVSAWNDVIITCMTILSSSESRDTFFRTGETDAIRLFNLSGIYCSTLFLLDSTNRPDTKMLAFTGDLFYKNESVSPRDFLEKMIRGGNLIEFQKDPLGWIKDIKNDTYISNGDKLCLFDPSNPDFHLQYMKADRDSFGMFVLPNSIIVSDASPSSVIIDNGNADIVDNKTNGVTSYNSVITPTPRNIFARIEEEWETFNWTNSAIDIFIKEIEQEQYRINFRTEKVVEIRNKITTDIEDSDDGVLYQSGGLTRESYKQRPFPNQIEIPNSVLNDQDDYSELMGCGMGY